MDNNKVFLFELSNYVKPEVNEYLGQKWVLYGKNNSGYDYIIDRYNGSPTNESVINVYCELLYGKGLAENGQDEIYEDLAEIFPKREQRKCLKDFKMFGQYAMEILRAKDRTSVAQINHVPINKLAVEKYNEKGEMNNVYYSYDWTKTYKYKPEPIPLFKGKLDKPRLIKLVQPYQAGNDYYSDPDYMAGLQYAELEEEISNYSINHIQNGLSFGYIINFNNGNNLEEEEKEAIVKDVRKNLVGSSNANKFIASFNDSKENEVTITALEVNDAHNQWEFWTKEARQQLITAHGAYPNLFGIPTSNGLSSNADELDVQSRLLQDYQINPKQELFIDELASIIEINGLNTDLEFIPLRETYKSTETVNEAPIQSDIVEDNTVDAEEDEEIELNSHICCSEDGEATVELADHLITFGEELDEKEWFLLAVNEVDYDTDDLIYESIKFATSTGVARPNSRSEQDSEDIAIRYRYVGNPLPEREFCRKMMFANKLYRKEDILQMERSGINDGFGLGGSNSYSIWLWKGGGKISAKFPNGTCKHKWQREIYLKRNGSVDVNSPLAKQISVADARRRGYSVPTNDAAVGRTPHNNKA